MSESFDRALRAAARRSRPAGVCPDAAMLASYADNGLSEDERRFVEAHVGRLRDVPGTHGAARRGEPRPRGARAVTMVARAMALAGAGRHGCPGCRRVDSAPRAEGAAGRCRHATAGVAGPAASGCDRTGARGACKPAGGTRQREQRRGSSRAKVAKAAPARAGQLADEKIDQLTPLERRDEREAEGRHCTADRAVPAPRTPLRPFRRKRLAKDEVAGPRQARRAESRRHRPPLRRGRPKPSGKKRRLPMPAGGARPIGS